MASRDVKILIIKSRRFFTTSYSLLSTPNILFSPSFLGFVPPPPPFVFVFVPCVFGLSISVSNHDQVWWCDQQFFLYTTRIEGEGERLASKERKLFGCVKRKQCGLLRIRTGAKSFRPYLGVEVLFALQSNCIQSHKW